MPIRPEKVHYLLLNKEGGEMREIEVGKMKGGRVRKKGREERVSIMYSINPSNIQKTQRKREKKKTPLKTSSTYILLFPADVAAAVHTHNPPHSLDSPVPDVHIVVAYTD